METPIGTQRLLIQARLERDNVLADLEAERAGNFDAEAELEEEFAYKYPERYEEMRRQNRPPYHEEPKSLDAFNATWFAIRMSEELICYYCIVGEVETYQTARGIVHLEIWPEDSSRTIYFERTNKRVYPTDELPEF